MSGISFDNYGIADWKWEFLRRNSRYQKAYRAVEWLKKRARRENVSPFFKGFGLLEPIHFLNLANRLQERLHLGHPPLKNVSQQLKKDSQQPGEWVGSLPSPSKGGPRISVFARPAFPYHCSLRPEGLRGALLRAPSRRGAWTIDRPRAPSNRRF